MKLDMSKAYDRVEWDYLDKIMDSMGFSGRWRGRIMKCISSVTFSVLVNGCPSNEFKPSRGIRQGDPLSPYLFLLCAEGFSALLRREESNSNLSSFKINHHCPSLSHLFFADDSLLFFRASEKDCNTIKGVINTYGKASGQLVNLDKSAFMTSKNVRRGLEIRCGDILGVQWTKNLGNYLGMPSSNNRNKN